MDIDYKAMSNCLTWMIGTLQTANDRKRVIDAVCVSGARYDKKSLIACVGALKPREFMIAVNAKTHKFLTRTVGARLVGPMSHSDIAGMYEQGLLAKPATPPNFLAQVVSLFK